MKKKARKKSYAIKAERAFRLEREKLRKRPSSVTPKVTKSVSVQAQAKATDGHALIHKEDQKIVLATIREDKKLVTKLGTMLKVNGAYRVGKVSVRETP